MKTLSKNFIARANEVMVLAFGKSVVAIKRANGYGSGEEIDLIFDLPQGEDRFDYEDLEEMAKMCPPILKDNVSGHIEVIIDCVPVHLDKFSDEEIQGFYKGLLKIKRRLIKLGF